jgi:type VI secretion system protein ImpC
MVGHSFFRFFHEQGEIMSRATISTGGVDFRTSERKSEKMNRDRDMPMHIAVLADFSGRKSRNQENLNSLSGRKMIAINRDNFDEVFSKLDVQLQLPVAEHALVFAELDNLHPDFIYARVGLFDKLRILQRKLKKKDSFAAAAEEIHAWTSYRNEPQVEEVIPEGIEMPSNLLDAALQGHDIAKQLEHGPLGNIDSLIKDIVSPYVEAKVDPRQAEMLAAVDEATSETMRAIMHHSDFQQLEATWRGLYWLLRQIESDSNISVFIMDVSQNELRADLARSEADSHCFQQLVEARGSMDDIPYAVILGDYQLQNTAEDADLALQMALLADNAKGCWLSAGHEQLAGCSALSESVDPDNWRSVTDEEDLSYEDREASVKWQQMRKNSSAAHLALAAPRFLLRLPFGNKTTSVESFDYQELAQDGSHDFYLWGNGAFLLTSLLAEGYNRKGWSALPGHFTEVDNLSLHVYEEDGESMVKPCAEVLLTDRSAAVLNDAGLLVLRSTRHKDRITVPNFQSMASSQCVIEGLW